MCLGGCTILPQRLKSTFGGGGTMLHSISEPCINSAELYFCPNVTQNDASAYDLMIKNYWGHFLSKYLEFFLILNENLDSI